MVAARTAGRDPVEYELLEIWRRVLRADSVGLRDDFFSLGGDSFAAVRLVTELEAAYGVRLAVGSVLEARTPEAVAALVRESGSGRGPARSLVAVDRRGSRAPLFLVHGAGGLLFFAHDLGRLLADRPLYGFQSVGLYGPEAPLQTVEAMADRYLAELGASGIPPPHALGGFSQGSLVAFEIALRLAGGRGVEHLLLFDPPLPGELSHDVADPVGFAYDFALLNLPDIPTRAAFEALSERDRVDCIVEAWTRADRLPPGLGGEFVESYLAVTRANLLAAAAYQPPRTFEGRATMFAVADDESRVSAAAWRRLAPGLRVVEVEGGHFSMFTPPYVESLARAVAGALDDL
jgi:thioesterase domain-containing protein/acyl carrier protein